MRSRRALMPGRPWTPHVRAAAAATLALLLAAALPVPSRAFDWSDAPLAPAAADLNAQAAAASAEGRTRDALALYLQAVKADPANAEAMYRLGCLLLAEDRAANAEQVFARLLARYPDDPDAILGHAAALARLPDASAAALASALAALGRAETRANEAAPSSPAIAYFRSQLHYRLGALDAALADAQTAVRLDADAPVSPAQTALYQQQEALCADMLATLSPIE